MESGEEQAHPQAQTQPQPQILNLTLAQPQPLTLAQTQLQPQILNLTQTQTQTLSVTQPQTQTLSLTDFSDEILLTILRFVPSCDLLLNVRKVNRKLAALCMDKSLISSVTLHKEYQESDTKVTSLLKEIAGDIQQLKLSGCYWLSGSTIDQVVKCKNILKLDLTGCRMTSLRLSRMLSVLRNLRSLALDVSQGFDVGQLSSECKATLGKVTELKQTLFTPSYGIVPCCTNLERLLLYFEIPDRTREGEMLSGQLMVGQSNIPHYQNLKVFYARLSPGYVNQEVGRFYLSVLSIRTPENLRAFILSVPGVFVDTGCSTRNFLDCMTKNFSLEALQLPRSWLNGSSLLHSSLLHTITLSNPVYLNFSHCILSGCQLSHQIINGGRNVQSLVSLNLSGCVHCLLSDCSVFRKAKDDIDFDVVEALVNCCPNLRHLNLSAAHHHSPEGTGRHLCLLLARLKQLRSLSLPVCCVAQSTKSADKLPNHAVPALQAQSVRRGLGKKVRIGVPTYPRNFQEQLSLSLPATVFGTLLENVPFLEELELIGSSFSSNVPRNEPAIRNVQPPCDRAQRIQDEELVLIGHLQHLRSLTLAQLPGILTGSGLIGIGLRCQQLQTLSLANLGLLGKVAYMPALCEMLKHCKQLKDLR
ncbi:F-box/LRR-repeat protein 18 isoform X1 [Chiloscyllium plagiosum]|uniref:F-box/LRR-repeat protein 18 isoform X1 n=1 Tax=Chiloscyllium plagiosum TaxID=36176 RepID=UPI001CB82391|nr:F-box/LRR-repeat protein 18 isoform X1 [Chiloscyllium plagiosum]XP_043541862.1 F-box/LRR-repeat protein 18 isoform X1 [Chiloscyllium plagiosum]XP_043541863.1 F-box/LRR-repeat protein 18 isoform X1 [Chiloscyllium plagiosum]XP_043541864.1 F-box/LRR-repeat protein 18 isoform X1 [Chiloscyllium plagiosum]